MSLLYYKHLCSICQKKVGILGSRLSKNIYICPGCMKQARKKETLVNILKLTPDEIKKLIAPKITKEYPLININEDIIKKYQQNNKAMLYVYIILYDNNSKIHIYTEDDEIIGDISENNVQEIINLGFKSGIIFLEKLIDDKTGDIFYTTSNLSCTT